MLDIIIIETLYVAIIVACTLTIYLLTRRLWHFSKYQGLNYYSLAFLYLLVGFLARYVTMMYRAVNGYTGVISEFSLITLAMEFFLVLPGLFLFYSMIWKRIERKNHSRYTAEIVLYAIALLIAAADTLLQGFYVMYTSQLLLFAALSIISYKKFLVSKSNYQQLFTISMVLFFLGWLFNLIAQYTITIIPVTRLYVYGLTLGAMVLLLFVHIRLLRDAT